MSAEGVDPPSPTLSVSLLEIKAETQLVLKAFLRHTLSLPPSERPGRVGGCAFSQSKRERRRRKEDGWDSLDDEISKVEEKKHGIKNLIKRRLKPYTGTVRRSEKDGSSKQPQNNTSVKDQNPELPMKVGSPATSPFQNKHEDPVVSSSIQSEEEERENKKDKKVKDKKKLKSQISSLFKLTKKEKPEKDDPCPTRPSKLSLRDNTPVEPTASPSHSPKFYENVADTLDKIAQRQTMKRSSPSSTPVADPVQQATDKEMLIKQLVEVLSMEADIIDEKIMSDPFLRSNLTRLSYPSFAKLLNTFASQSDLPPPDMPVPASPTLRRIAVTMEMSRRVVTATGTQRMQGYAERYMETFAPWVKSQGGWENIVQLEENLEYD